MANQSINMTKPNMLYAGGIIVLLIISLLLTNLPFLRVSTYWAMDPNLKKYTCFILFSMGCLSSVGVLMKYIARTQQPWRVPQSQVTYLYALSFVTMLLALVLSK